MKGYQEYKVESFWGAIATLVLLQIFNYFIFQSFLFYLHHVQIIWGSITVGLSIFFQLEMIGKIKLFLNTPSLGNNPLLLDTYDEQIKCALTIGLAFLLILFLKGFFPLPIEPYGYIALVTFYAFNWGVSYVFAGSSKTSYLSNSGANWKGMIIATICLLLFVGTTYEPRMFYSLGIVLLYLGMVLTSYSLLKKQIV